MNKVILFSMVFMISLAWSCTDENELNANDHSPLIFGSSHGFCQGNCTHLFKYENGQVFRDEMDRLDLDNLLFSNTPEEELLASAQKIFESLPEELKSNSQETYGCPDCADQGTLFLQLTEGDGSRQWFLDTRIQEDWSQELKDFVRLLKEELDEIIIF